MIVIILMARLGVWLRRATHGHERGNKCYIVNYVSIEQGEKMRRCDLANLVIICAGGLIMEALAVITILAHGGS